jgi:hypothetical protein
MKTSLFTLTKSEQRIVIVIMMLLLAGAFARSYRNATFHVYKEATTTATPKPLPAEGEENPPNGGKDD